jgi:hypothetical protein
MRGCNSVKPCTDFVNYITYKYHLHTCMHVCDGTRRVCNNLLALAVLCRNLHANIKQALSKTSRFNTRYIQKSVCTCLSFVCMLFCVVMLNLQLTTRPLCQHINTELQLIKTLPLDSMFHASATSSLKLYAMEILLS